MSNPKDWSRWSGAPACGFGPLVTECVLEEMATLAAADAIQDAELKSAISAPPDRRGCVIGVSKTVIANVGDAPLAGCFTMGRPSLTLAAQYEADGPVITPSAACATGLVSLIRGADLIRQGDCDFVLAGSADWSLSTTYLAGYRRLGVLAKPDDDPASACKPFDRRRNGFSVGCGAAILVLEDWNCAVERGAPIHAEWLGHAMAGDAASIVDVDSSGKTPARVIADAMRRSAVRPQQIDAVSLHGTATHSNDVCESRAIKLALGEAAPSASCFSIKGSIGHLMGAAGSVETATLVMALREQCVPLTANLQEPDPECPLDCTAGESRFRRIDHALKLSQGFGGACAAAVLRRPETSAGDIPCKSSLLDE